MSIVSRLALGATVLSFAVVSPATAQVVRGEVRDLDTHAPMKQTSVALWNASDYPVQVHITTDSGKFSFRVPEAGQYSINLRRVPYGELTMKPFSVGANDTITLTLEMAKLPQVLDTVLTRESSGVFSMNAGQEYVRKHFIEGKGLIVSGWLIERSGKTLSEYLGSLAGLHLSGTFAIGTPTIPAGKGEFLLSDHGPQCLYARVDRYSLLSMLMQQGAETIDDMLKLNDIMAVEVYSNHADIPKEWGQEGIVDELYTRLNNGHQYTIGHTGFPVIRAMQMSDDIYGVAAVDSVHSHIPACGFVQIWTGAAWGRHPGH